MTAIWLNFNLGPKEDRWAQMLLLSFVFHLAIFSTTLFVSRNTIYYPSLTRQVYHVELVSAPPPLSVGEGTSAGGIATGKGASPVLKAKTRRIAVRKKPPASIVAKRVSSRPITAFRKKETTSPSELIEGAISRIERKATEQEAGRLEETLSQIERKLEKEKKEQPQGTAKRAEGDGTPLYRERKGGLPLMSSVIGKGIQLYQIEIEKVIKSNWSYPVALLNAPKGKTPVAVILLTVRNDGKILNARFKKRSGDSLFNDSVLKAIERSDPLPKFPPGYYKNYDEVEINFSLKDLIQY